MAEAKANPACIPSPTPSILEKLSGRLQTLTFGDSLTLIMLAFLAYWISELCSILFRSKDFDFDFVQEKVKRLNIWRKYAFLLLTIVALRLPYILIFDEDRLFGSDLVVYSLFWIVVALGMIVEAYIAIFLLKKHYQYVLNIAVLARMTGRRGEEDYNYMRYLVHVAEIMEVLKREWRL